MFFYVLIYKSVLITLICMAFLIVFVVLKVIVRFFPNKKWLLLIKDFFSYALFFNIPFRYFQLVLLDLFISAFMTFRTVAREDAYSSRVFISRTVDKVVSVTFACLFFATTILFLLVIAKYAFWRRKSIKQVSHRIADLKWGMLEGRRCRTVFYYTQFVIIRILLALVVALTEIIPSIA